MRITGPSGQPSSIFQQTDSYATAQGETLKSIADKFGISESDLAMANNLAQGIQLRPGQQLYIPKLSQQSTTIQKGIGSIRDGFESSKTDEISAMMNPMLPSTTSYRKPQSLVDPSFDLNKAMDDIRFKAAFQSPVGVQRKPVDSDGLTTGINPQQFGPQSLTNDNAAKLGPQKLAIDGSTMAGLEYAMKYPPAIRNLVDMTGKSPDELVALFKKYGLDPRHMPEPPNGQVAALFNDPSFDSYLNSLKQQETDAYQNYKDEIAAQTAAANSINASNVASDTSVIDNLNTAPFHYLYNAYHGGEYTDEGKMWYQSRQAEADRAGSLLSAMYPGAAVGPATGDPTYYNGKGYIEFNGKMLNMIPASENGRIQFVEKNKPGFSLDRPHVDLIPWQYDAEGDAEVSVPDWMTDAGYPTHAYDTPWWE